MPTDYVDGVVPSQLDPLVERIASRSVLSPRTAMPTLGMDTVTTGNISAYLYALR